MCESCGIWILDPNMNIMGVVPVQYDCDTEHHNIYFLKISVTAAVVAATAILHHTLHHNAQYNYEYGTQQLTTN